MIYYHVFLIKSIEFERFYEYAFIGDFMKRVIGVIIMIFLLSVRAEALKHYSRYLAIERGKDEIEMLVGEQIRLRTYSGVLAIPIIKGLEYNSTESGVVTVDNSGIVYANKQGETYITVIDSLGRTDSILITVKRGSKPFLPSLIIIIGVGVGTFAIVLYQNKTDIG